MRSGVRQGWLALAAGLVLVVAVGLLAVRLVTVNRAHHADMMLHLDVIGDASVLRYAVSEANSTQRGLVMTGSDLFRTRFAEAMRALEEAGAELQGSAQAAGADPRLMADIVRLLDERLAELRAMDRLLQQGRIEDMIERSLLARAQTDLIQQRLDQLVARERQALTQGRERAEDSGRMLLVATVGGLGLAILLVAAAIRQLRARATSLEAANAEIRQLSESLERRVAERTADLEDANAEIQRFAYVVSHDLRSPLVNVMGFTSELAIAHRQVADWLDQLERDGHPLPAETAAAVRHDMPESIGFIQASTGRMDRLIRAILELSREGRRALAFEEVDLAALVAGLAVTLKTQLDAAEARLEIDELPTLTTDRMAVEQILANLLDNAIKYLRPGVPGLVRVWAEPERRDWLVHIEDNGRGIAPHDRERVFELFRRAGTQDRPGEGIGLAHVRALARRLGGAVLLSSVPGEGSRFTLKLPSARALCTPSERRAA